MVEEGKRKQARRHHYLPQFYLAGFTPSGKKEDKLWVFDLDTGKKFATAAKNVACEKDLYRWEGITGHEDFLEIEAFQKIDDLASKVIENMTLERKVPARDSDDYFNLMQFIAAFKIRTPRSQKEYEEMTKQLLRATTNVITQSEEVWQIVKNRALGEEGKDFSREQMREVVFDESKFRTVVPREAYLKTMSERLQYLIQVISKRKWSFCENPEGDLICSDNPLVICWTKPVSSNRSPRLLHKNTRLVLPLTKKTALVGSFESDSIIPAIDKIWVAWVNFLELQNAHRFCFAPSENFSWLKDNGTISNADESMEWIKTRRGRPSGRPASY